MTGVIGRFLRHDAKKTRASRGASGDWWAGWPWPTDRLDAALLARMGTLLQLEARPACPDVIVELRQLHIAREGW